MAVYRLGDVLRIKRKALGLSREKLCAMSNEICSPQTLYRIECGRVKVKPKVFRCLMECMGEIPERNYTSIAVQESQALNLKSEIQIHLYAGEYEQIEKILQQLEQVMDLDYARNQQYLIEKKATLAFLQKNLTAEQYQRILFDALRCTIPELERIDPADWPYNEQEFSIMLLILNTYHIMGSDEKELELLLKLKDNTEKHYMSEYCYASWHTTILSSLAALMRRLNEYEKATQYCSQAIEECKRYRILGITANLLCNTVLNMQNQRKNEPLSEPEREYCKKLLTQSYYLSIAQKKNSSADWIKKLCERYYPGEIELF